LVPFYKNDVIPSSKSCKELSYTTQRTGIEVINATDTRSVAYDLNERGVTV